MEIGIEYGVLSAFTDRLLASTNAYYCSDNIFSCGTAWEIADGFVFASASSFALSPLGLRPVVVATWRQAGCNLPHHHDLFEVEEGDFVLAGLGLLERGMNLEDGWPLLGFAKQSGDQLDEARTVQPLDWLLLQFDDIVGEGLDGGIFEGVFQGAEVVQAAAQSPDVNWEGIQLVLDHLGSEVDRSAHPRRQQLAVLTQQLRKPQIAHLNSNQYTFILPSAVRKMFSGLGPCG